MANVVQRPVVSRKPPVRCWNSLGLSAYKNNMLDLPKSAREADTPADICARLKALRRAFSLTQTEMAERLGLGSQQAWQNYETGKRPLDYTVALVIAQQFHAPLDWIYRGLTAMIPLHLAEKLAAEEPPKPTRRRKTA